MRYEILVRDKRQWIVLDTLKDQIMLITSEMKLALMCQRRLESQQD